MTVDDGHQGGHPPPPRRYLLPVAAATAVVTSGGVIAVQLLWPWTAEAIHDGVSIVHVIITTATLSVRRRKS